MRYVKLAVIAVALAGCAAGSPAGPDRAAQTASCAQAVAAHVGKPVEAVTATWSGMESENVAVVTVSDQQGTGAERVHTCDVNAAGQVLAIRHPGA
jgi:hypothetical protein